MSYKKKINWLLILQAWAMLWVVIGHAFIGDIKNQVNWPFWERSLMDFAYSFHMPLFMLISGWLFYYTRLKHDFILTGGGGYISLIKDKVTCPEIGLQIEYEQCKLYLGHQWNRN